MELAGLGVKSLRNLRAWLIALAMLYFRFMNNRMAQHEGMIFDRLTESSAFRSDLLYFIRLAGNYAAHIFTDVRERANSPVRREYAEWLTTQAVIKDKKLYNALLLKKGWFDALAHEFRDMLETMPQRMQNRFLQALTQDHLIPMDRHNFLKMIDDLRLYRNWLEHYGDGKPQPVSDIRLLDILGLMLLPFMGNQLLGRIHHHGRRIKLRELTKIRQRAKARLDQALASRREASKFMNGLKRRSDLESVRQRITRKYGNVPSDVTVHRIAKEDAKKRRDLEHRKATMLALHQRYFDAQTWPRYNFENFLLRYAFIGKGRIAALETLLTQSPNNVGTLDFAQDIEPAFMLSVEIGLIFHSWLGEVEEAGVKIRNKKKVGPIIPALRNEIAHGGWFWHVEDPTNSGSYLSLTDLLQATSTLTALPEIRDGADRHNQLLTKLIAALRPCSDHLIYARLQPGDDPNRHPPPYRVKRWTPATRSRFSDKTRWRIERRHALRRIAASWMREIQHVN